EKHEEDDVRGEGYARNPRDETQQQASDDEANRIRRLQPLSERGEHGDEDQQQEDDELQRLHVAAWHQLPSQHVGPSRRKREKLRSVTSRTCPRARRDAPSR